MATGLTEPPSPEVEIQFVYTPLAPEQLRWYYHKAPYTIKGVATNPEIPHRGSLYRFCDSDNAALEAAYRSRAEEYERCWWQEEAELVGPRGGGGTAAGRGGGGGSPTKQHGSALMLAAQQAPDAPLSWQDFMTLAEQEEEAEEAALQDGMGGSMHGARAVLVRSGAHEVDLRRRLMRPCYWPAACHRVLRGAWFAEKGGEWVPLKESLTDQVEEGYRQALWLPSKGRLALQQPGGFFAARLDLNTSVDKNLYALYASEGEVFLCQESSFGWLRRLGPSGLAEARLRLRRGYEAPLTKALLEKEADLRAEEADNYCAATPVTRLVLVVHGIGQQLSAANIAQDATNFRSVMRQVAADQLPDEERAAGRTEVLPVQWRKQLTLEIDALSPHLMPPGVRALREVLFATIVEVLLYLTPLHRADILRSLVTALNATYCAFLRRNPRFKGTVSVLAHSLGSVLCHDILCNQPVSAYAPLLLPTAPSPGGSAPGLSPSPGAAPAAAGASCEPMDTCEGAAGDACGEGAEEAEGGPPQQHGQQAQQAGRVDDRVAALQQEVSRLRAENNRLALQLDVARADTARAAPSPPWGSPPLVPPGGGSSLPGGVGAPAGPSPALPAASLHHQASWHDRQPPQQAQQPGVHLDLAQQLQQHWAGGRLPAAAAAAAATAAGPPPTLGMEAAAAAGVEGGGGLASPGAADPAEECGVTAGGSAVVVEALKFPVDQLVLIGSPISVFLALRGVHFSKGRGLGTPASAPLNQTAPDHPCAPDGLPAARRMYNLYHPFDPVGHRLEPLAVPLGELQRPAFAPLHKGGKRIHIQVQEFGEDVSTAASRFGTSLLSSLAFAKFTKAVAKAPGLEGGGAAADVAGALAGEGSLGGALSPEPSDLPTGNATLSEVFGGGGSIAPGSLPFGQPAADALHGTSATEAGPAISHQGGRPPRGSAPGDPGSSASLAAAAAGAASVGQQAPQQAQRGAPWPRSTFGRLTDGVPDPQGPKSGSAVGRLDFVLQESTLENQYLSALSAHFGYWTSPDVALFVLRAVHGMDVLSGAPKQAQQGAGGRVPSPEAVRLSAPQGGPYGGFAASPMPAARSAEGLHQPASTSMHYATLSG